MAKRSQTLYEGDLLLELLQHAQRTEGAVEVKGDWQGMPYMIVVAVGANAGLLEKYARSGTLRLTPNDTGSQ